LTRLHPEEKALMFGAPKDNYNPLLNRPVALIKQTSAPSTDQYYGFTHQNDG